MSNLDLRFNAALPPAIYERAVNIEAEFAHTIAVLGLDKRQVDCFREVLRQTMAQVSKGERIKWSADFIGDNLGAMAREVCESVGWIAGCRVRFADGDWSWFVEFE